MERKPSFEQEVKEFLRAKRVPFRDGSRSFEKLDFAFTVPGTQVEFSLDVKEKRPRYRLSN